MLFGALTFSTALWFHSLYTYLHVRCAYTSGALACQGLLHVRGSRMSGVLVYQVTHN